MKHFYQLTSAYDDRFTRAGRRGTWTSPKLCEKCGVPFDKRVSPLVVEWEPDGRKKENKKLADFTWPGYLDDLLVTDRIKRDFQNRFKGVTFGPVIIKNDETGPSHAPLWDFLINNVFDLDIELSELREDINCAVCKRIFYEPYETGSLVAHIRDRDFEFFGLQQYDALRFATEDVMKFIIEQGYTNISFTEAGVIR